MSPQHVEWPTEWGVLFALTLPSDQTISSKVRLNKILALLQRDGFPIQNRFINLEMGPMDFSIHDHDAMLLQKMKYISVDEEPIRNKKPLTVYRLHDEGRKYFQRKYSCIIDNLPYKSTFKSKMDEIRRSFHLATSEIVDRVHLELQTQATPEALREKIDAIEDSLSKTVKVVEQNRDDSCPVCVEILGSSEFAMKSLRNSIEKGLGGNDSGKNMVFYNAAQILYWAEKLARHDHVTDVRTGTDTLSRLREQVCYRLYCLEENAGHYGIAQPIRDESNLSEYLQQHIGGEI